MKTSSGSNAAIWKAYPDSQVDLWDQNLVNGEYVIAFEMNPGLGQSLQNLLPAVSNMAQKGGSILLPLFASSNEKNCTSNANICLKIRLKIRIRFYFKRHMTKHILADDFSFYSNAIIAQREKSHYETVITV